MSPIELTLPWDCVLHDNHKHMPAMIAGKARLILSSEYRAKKESAENSIFRQLNGIRPLDGELRLIAHVWMPDRRKRDAGNYRKLITDAMTQLAYTDDSQLISETWERAGFDKDNPRIDLTISPVPEEAHESHQS